MLHATRFGYLALLLFAGTAFADRAAVEGRWLTQEQDGWIRISLIGESLEGRIAGAPPGSPEEREFDDRNPDPSLRTRKLDGLVIMSGFEYDGDGRWKNGTVYDPNNGKTYRCTITLIDANTLKVRGFVGVSLFGRSATWTRDDPDTEAN
ncbi:MAG: DUF2147 domain-containing protein [Woeseiaceae bacterium]|nr:DUF2147 domain-containing protein [Woeseiaceae bacterium]